jgi:hypothetical protein
LRVVNSSTTASYSWSESCHQRSKTRKGALEYTETSGVQNSTPIGSQLSMDTAPVAQRCISPSGDEGDARKFAPAVRASRRSNGSIPEVKSIGNLRLEIDGPWRGRRMGAGRCWPWPRRRRHQPSRRPARSPPAARRPARPRRLTHSWPLSGHGPRLAPEAGRPSEPLSESNFPA